MLSTQFVLIGIASALATKILHTPDSLGKFTLVTETSPPLYGYYQPGRTHQLTMSYQGG